MLQQITRKASAFVLAVFLAFAGITTVVTPETAYAAPGDDVDLKVQLITGITGNNGEAFEWTAIINNVGTNPVAAFEMRLQLSEEVADLKIVCTSATAGAVCPAAASDPLTQNMGININNFPQNSELKFKITGFYTNGHSITTTLEADVHAPQVDIDPLSNSVTQQVGLTPAPQYNITLTKTADKSEINSGDTVTFTVTYINNEPRAVPLYYVQDQFEDLGEPLEITEYEYSISCDAANTTVPCPNYANGQTTTISNPGSTERIFRTDVMVFPAGGKLTLKIPVKVTYTGCATTDQYLWNFAEWSQMQAVGYTDNPVAVQVKLIKPVCPPSAADKLKVKKIADRSTINSGDTITYTITYSNESDQPLQDIRVTDQLFNAMQGRDDSGTFTVKCDVAATAPCPAWIQNANGVLNTDGGYLFKDELIDLPEQSDLVLKAEVVITYTGCAEANDPDLRITNEAQLYLPNGQQRYDDVTVIATDRVRCSDVSTTTAVKNSNPDAASELIFTSTVTNVNYDATNVPVTIQFPVFGFLKTAATEQPECVISTVSGAPVPANAQCPVAWVYDSATHELKATFAKIPAGVIYTITTRGKAGVVPSGTLSYRVSTIAPYADDVTPVVGTLNQSDATFILSNTQTTAKAKLTITGFNQDQAPEDVTITGEMRCVEQGNFPVTITVPQGSNTAEVLITDKLWKHDNCKVTLVTPTGNVQTYFWDNWIQGPTDAQQNIVAPALFNFVIGVATTVTAPDLPETGGIGSEMFYIGGAFIAILASLTVALLWVTGLGRKAISAAE